LLDCWNIVCVEGCDQGWGMTRRHAQEAGWYIAAGLCIWILSCVSTTSWWIRYLIHQLSQGVYCRAFITATETVKIQDSTWQWILACRLVVYNPYQDRGRCNVFLQALIWSPNNFRVFHEQEFPTCWERATQYLAAAVSVPIHAWESLACLPAGAQSTEIDVMII